MRKINTRDFSIATRTTSRDINRRIALNVIHEHQPISRADFVCGISGNMAGNGSDMYAHHMLPGRSP